VPARADAERDAVHKVLRELRQAERKRKEKASQEAGNRPNPTPTPSDEPSQQPSLGPAEDDSNNPAPPPSDSSDGDGGGDDGGGWSGDRAMTAVNYALAQVGKPYSYSANPPRSWDCSKLTAAAWARAGVSLTAYSYAQAGQVRRVSKNNLKPGDILFYFNGARHVAMYIGNGMLVEAASPRLGVRVAPLWNSWSARHYSYAGRPVG
jgi:cell wall-associated NlpC family hydrolase